MTMIQTRAAAEITPATASDWPLDPDVTFLNHGSYGVCPRPVLAAQRRYQDLMEREPVRWFLSEQERLLDAARDALGGLINASPGDIGWTPNATISIATVLFSLGLEPGDQVLVNSHEYMSVVNELGRMSARHAVECVVADLPLRPGSDDQLVEALLASVTERTRLAIVSQVTSPSAMILPVERITRELQARGVEVLIDGAHGPGQVETDLARLGADFYAADLHKWVCTPKGAGVLWVREDHQHRVRPLALSSRAHSERSDRGRFLRDFDYMGTDDHTPMIATRDAIAFMSSQHPEGFPGVMRRNHDLACRARRLVCEAIGVEPPVPESLVPSMASIPLPPLPDHLAGIEPVFDDPLQDRLVERHSIQIPVWTNSLTGERSMRLSVQLYNTPEQYERLAEVLAEELEREQRGG